VVATLCLRFYLRWITSTGYTYGALSTPIAFLLYAFFAGFAIMLGAELNAAVQEEFPAPKTHAHRLRKWLVSRVRGARTSGTSVDSPPAQQNTVTAEPPN
jgi:membrane protein